MDLKPCLESGICGRFDAANQSGQGTAYVYYWRSMLRQPNQRTLEHIVCFKSHRCKNARDAKGRVLQMHHFRRRFLFHCACFRDMHEPSRKGVMLPSLSVLSHFFCFSLSGGGTGCADVGVDSFSASRGVVCTRRMHASITPYEFCQFAALHSKPTKVRVWGGAHEHGVLAHVPKCTRRYSLYADAFFVVFLLSPLVSPCSLAQSVNRWSPTRCFHLLSQCCFLS